MSDQEPDPDAKINPKPSPKQSRTQISQVQNENKGPNPKPPSVKMSKHPDSSPTPPAKPPPTDVKLSDTQSTIESQKSSRKEKSNAVSSSPNQPMNSIQTRTSQPTINHVQNLNSKPIPISDLDLEVESTEYNLNSKLIRQGKANQTTDNTESSLEDSKNTKEKAGTTSQNSRNSKDNLNPSNVVINSQASEIQHLSPRIKSKTNQQNPAVKGEAPISNRQTVASEIQNQVPTKPHTSGHVQEASKQIHHTPIVVEHSQMKAQQVHLTPKGQDKPSTKTYEDLNLSKEHVYAIYNYIIIAEADRHDIILMGGNTYFPPECVHHNFLTATKQTYTWNGQGTGLYYDVNAEGKKIRGGAWKFVHPTQYFEILDGYYGFWRGVNII